MFSVEEDKMDLTDFPTTAVEFDDRFSSEEACRAYLARVRWPDGFRCPRCGHGEAWDVGRRHLLECRSCGHQASLTAGTVLHGTRKPLHLWFKAIFLAACHKTGTSACNLQRQLGLRSYQTAWTWLHKIRRAMVRPGREPLSGVVEVDDSYVGGEEKNVFGRGAEDKSVVAVAVEVRGEGAGRLRMERLPDVSSASLHPFVQRNVAQGSTVKTDAFRGYAGLGHQGYHHRPRVIGRPERAPRLFPHVHRAVSLLKRWLLGIYQGAVHAKHLPAYLDEFVFRFNRRGSAAPTLLFRRVCEIAVVTRPLPYRALVAQDVVVA